ncbi:MAG: Rrf2 family transcriptional regulator [Bacteroidota bacterium]
MFLNKTTKYAISLLAYMANKPHERFSAETLHHELNIPRRYLRLLLTDLSKYGFILSSRGRNGGFCLCRNPEDISIAQVIDSLEGLSNYDTCFFGIQNCKNEKPCSMHKTWNDTRSILIESLSNTSLSELGNNCIIKF